MQGLQLQLLESEPSSSDHLTTYTNVTKQMRRRREALERGEDPSNIGPPSSSPASPPDPTKDPRQNKRSKRKKK